MRMKQMHRRILEGCLACLLCFTGSIPAFAAGTATQPMPMKEGRIRRV